MVAIGKHGHGNDAKSPNVADDTLMGTHCLPLQPRQWTTTNSCAPGSKSPGGRYEAPPRSARFMGRAEHLLSTRPTLFSGAGTGTCPAGVEVAGPAPFVAATDMRGRGTQRHPHSRRTE